MTSSAAARLRDRLGADAVDDSEATYRYAAAGVVPSCIVAPADAAGVAAAVRLAREAQLALVPAGRATHLEIGHPPRRYDAALSTRRMARIIAHEAGDMTVTVEAGVTIGALQYALAAERQWLPLDPPRAAEMTVGGLIAADRSGPLRCAYGKVRDWLLGVRVVMADGACVRGGGRVVKNVAGYDLPKLFAGSFGTLGVIVEATFKVRPLPDAEAMFVWPTPTFADALSCARRTTAAPLFPTVLEAINDPAGESIGVETGPCLVIGCDGATAHLEEQERRLEALSDGAARRIDSERAAALRRALADFSQPANEDGIVVRLSALPSALAALLGTVETAAAERGIVCEIAAHAGNGVAWCQLLGAAELSALAEFADWLRKRGREHAAWVVFESLPEGLRGWVDPWGFDAPARQLMTGIKRALDPDDVFSPGRFVGGI